MSDIEVKVLFLASNPKATDPLALDEEIREITQKIRAAEYRDSIDLISAWAVRPDDLLQMLNQHKPQIVHFSCHGNESGEIILTNDSGKSKPVSIKALKELFTTLKDNIKVVFLNCCFSEEQAKAITQVIDCAVGMSDAIGDEAAITFAASFYRAIGFGRSVKEAFDQGIVALLLKGIPEENTPELLLKDGVDPSKVILLELSDPINIAPDPKIITGGTGLTAGRDAHFGDVTGQVAIGEHINLFKIGKLSGDALVKLEDFLQQKRQEEFNVKILSSYSFSAIPEYPSERKKFVTTNRAEELNKALVYLQDHRILLFTGIGGVGKTTLARALIDLRKANVPIPFWFDFGMNQSARLGDILEKLASYMKSPDIAEFREEKREPEKKDIDKFTDKLQTGYSIWLIFDNLETILEGVNFQDDAMDLFFTCLRNSTYQARIIITSRTFPKLKNGEDLVDVIEGEKQDIKGLMTNFAVDYLVKNGLGNLERDKLEELAKGVDGHPLALQLLVGLVNEFGEEDILEDLSIYQEEKEDTILKARKLFDKLAGGEKELLERISVYREPIGMKGIKEMAKGKNPLNVVKELIDKSLLETDHKGKYWLHPLVQEFSYEDLKKKKEAHLIAYNYYKSLGIPENLIKKEDLQPAIEAHYHACEAGEYDMAYDIICKFNLEGLLDLWGYPKTLIEIYEKLLPKDRFKDEPVLKDKKLHEKVLENLGRTYRRLGEKEKAIEYHKLALKIAREKGDRRGEGIWFGNLGRTYRDLGDKNKAIECYEQAKKIAREIGDKNFEGVWLGCQGNAYLALGDPKKSIEYNEQALKIARETRHCRRQGIRLGYLGHAYYQLGDKNKAIECYEQALKIAREIGDRRNEGVWLGSQGLVYSDLDEPKKAIEFLNKSLAIWKSIGDQWIISFYEQKLKELQGFNE